MKGAYKEFEPGLYNTYDGPAKQAMKVHLELSGHRVTVPFEDFNADIYSDYHDVRMYHEVEVTNNWVEGMFPFPTGSIPERKLRLSLHYKNAPLFFWRLRHDLKRTLVYSAAHLTDEWLVEVPNRKIGKGEYFYRPPVELGKEFDLLCK